MDWLTISGMFVAALVALPAMLFVSWLSASVLITLLFMSFGVPFDDALPACDRTGGPDTPAGPDDPDDGLDEVPLLCSHPFCSALEHALADCDARHKEGR